MISAFPVTHPSLSVYVAMTDGQGKVPVTVIKLDGQLDGQTYQDLIVKAREAYAAGWRDLEVARALGGETNDLLAVRQELVCRALAEVETYLAADDPSGALLRLEQLERNKISGDQLRALKQIARWMESARTLSRRGKFAEAETQLASAAALRPDLPALEQRRAARGSPLR